MPKNKNQSEDLAPPSSRPRILVAWSPVNSGSEAIDVAAWIARTTDVRIRVVTTLLRPWPGPSIAKMGKKYQKWLAKESAAVEKAVRAELDRAGVSDAHLDSTFSQLVDGANEAALLATAAKDFRASLIVLGSGASAPKGRFHPGNTADTLLRASTTPLGLAPRAPKLSKRGVTRISFAIVDEQNHTSALNRAATLANSLDVPLRILALSPIGLGDVLTGEDLHVPKDLILEWRENSFATLDRLSDTLHDTHPTLNVETAVGSGIGWNGALDAIKWNKGDLLTFASTAASPLERVLVGSQTTEILRHVQVPVLMLPEA